MMEPIHLIQQRLGFNWVLAVQDTNWRGEQGQVPVALRTFKVRRWIHGGAGQQNQLLLASKLP